MSSTPNDTADDGESKMGSPEICQNEETQLVGSKRRELTPEVAARCKLQAVVVSWISVILFTVLGIASLALAYFEESSSDLAFGVSCILDSLSSVVVVWRYSSNGGTDTLYSVSKDRTAGIAIGALFIVGAISVAGKAIYELCNMDNNIMNELFIILFASEAIVCAILGGIKIYLGRMLDSVALDADGFNSLISAVMALSGLLSTLLENSNAIFRYLDPIVGIACSVLFVAYGIWIIRHELKHKET